MICLAFKSTLAALFVTGVFLWLKVVHLQLNICLFNTSFRSCGFGTGIQDFFLTSGPDLLSCKKNLGHFMHFGDLRVYFRN
jgi:hypothetical protein